MAYTAVISLKQTIHRLLNSSHISITDSSRQILESSYKQLESLQEALRTSDASRSRSTSLNNLDEKITDVLHHFEDELESHASIQFHSRSESNGEDVSTSTLPFELDLKEIWLETTSFSEEVKKLKKEYVEELNNPFSEAAAASPSQTTEADVKMVGMSDVFDGLKEHLTRILRPDDFGFFSFYGMAGIGRSIVANIIYNDVYAVGNEQSFDCGAWVRIGSTYTLKQTLLNIIAQLNDSNQHFLESEGEDELTEHLHSYLEGKRYIIALDDVPNTDILMQLRMSLLEQNNGSLVFITTSVMEVAAFDESFFVYESSLLMDEYTVWNYIRQSILGEEPISEFEEAGKKIARFCRGRRFVVARVLLKLMRSGKRRVPEFWTELAADEHAPIFIVEDEISEIREIVNYLRPIDIDWFKDLFNFSEAIRRIKTEHLFPDRLFPKMGIMSVYGMAGIGKTTLVKKLLRDPSISRRFDNYIWINTGSKYKTDQILTDIAVQIDPNIDQANVETDLSNLLSDKKCLIVLDDLWSQDPVLYLKRFMPNIKGELMVTTRLLQVAIFGPYDRSNKPRLLNEEESWDLLREKVFGEENCPYQLEKIGRKIAKKCEGLPLLILAVADMLSKTEETLDLRYLSEVVEGKNSVFMDANREVSKALTPSYEGLPQYLKTCFLYMGVFPEKCKISTSNLMKLWLAEGFLEPNLSQTFEEFASRCFKELLNSSMVMSEQGSDLVTIKTCVLHNVFWHLSNTEAIKSKFFHTLSAHDDALMECRDSQRRLCIRNSILLGIKDDAMAAFPTLRAFLCTGAFHRYQVPLCFSSRLVRVLDTLAIRFYEFPVEVVKLIFLRYLSLTCSGDIPSSIAKLLSLQFLIVRHHLSIQSSIDSSYLPREIWDMKELKHLQITGSKLPSPNDQALLPNLSSLQDVSVHSCTNRIFRRIPNLKKLGIQIELVPDDHNCYNLFHWLNPISHLHKLESLKCVVANPDLGLEVVAPPLPPILPSTLKKLSLSGLGFSWEYMSIIGELQNLEVLKLGCYAFRGPTWEIDCHHFSKLKSLSIEDTDLERWDINMPSISSLQSLCLKDCYNLEQLPPHLPVTVEKLEVIDSHPLAENWAKEMKQINWETKLKTLEPHIQSPWNEEN